MDIKVWIERIDPFFVEGRQRLQPVPYFALEQDSWKFRQNNRSKMVDYDLQDIVLLLLQLAHQLPVVLVV